MTKPTFYTVSNARYFVGTVALLNSLRLTGNAGELVVLDAGLESSQRRRLEEHATIVRVPHDVAVNPLLLKAFPATLGPSGLVMVIDSDIVVTGSLAPMLERALRGSICVYPDKASRRWFAEWEQLFGLAAPLRRSTYVNSGFVAFSVDAWPNLLSRWEEAAAVIPSELTRAGGAAQATPLWDGDQDALNAILMSEVPETAVELLPNEEAPTTFRKRREVRVLDRDRLMCTYAGVQTVFVHSAGTPKPWEPTGWTHGIWRDGYVALLPRVLFGEGLLVSVPPRDLPVWLRVGRGPERSTRALDYAHTVAQHLPKWFRALALAAVQRSRRARRLPRAGGSPAESPD